MAERGAWRFWCSPERFDPTADRVIDLLNDRGVAVFRVDTAEFPQRLRLSAALAVGGSLVGEHRQVDLAEICPVWYRRPTGFDLPEESG